MLLMQVAVNKLAKSGEALAAGDLPAVAATVGWAQPSLQTVPVKAVLSFARIQHRQSRHDYAHAEYHPWRH